MKYFLLIVFPFFLLGCSVLKPTTNKEQIPNLDIYLLIGQSNMAGRAEIPENEKDSLNMVFLFRNDSVGIWEKAANPLNKYSTVRKGINMQKLGPGYSFAKKISNYYPGRNVGLVVNARGGTSIKEWAPSGRLYKEALKRIKEASRWGKVKGILWHQGEADFKTKESYISDLKYLVESFRNDLDNSSLPFVLGQIYLANKGKKGFNDLLLEVPRYIPYTGVVKSDSTSTFDNLHFDTASQILMGERYAEAMRRIIDDLNNDDNQ